jgi:hypothetical protein
MIPIVRSATALGVALALATTSLALADSPPTVQEQIDAALRAEPGGIQTGPNTARFDNGTAILTIPDLAARSVGSCTTGSFCAYSGTSLTGAKLTFTSCSVHSTAALTGGVHSIANATSLGIVYGETSSGTVLSTVLAGASQSSSPSGIAQLDCL